MTRDLQSAKLAIARVTGGQPGAPGAPLLGTAFFVGEGYALSALHVVENASVTDPRPRAQEFWLDFVDAGHQTRAHVVARDRLHDWVILKLETPPLVEPIACGPLPRKDAVWEVYGFPAINQAGQTIRGTVTDPRARDPIGVGARRIEAIQLWCQEAGSGLGAPLHGFSGSPCLIDGCAVGLLRSTLSTSALDGQGRPQLLTQGGTAYACPATVIVDRDDPPDRLPIPGGWSRPVAASDFVVVTSVNEKTARQKLVTVAENAREKVPELGLGPAWALEAEEQVASEEALLGAVRILCRARVVVFDATGFEPAVMLLLGIRAAVRRGVTILSIGGSYVLGDRVSVPFNLLDANIVSHSTNQDRSGDEETTPIPLLARRIERSVKQIGSPHYFDLPVFEAVRRLPAERRGVRPAESGVLVLCSFAPAYTKKNWAGRLKMAFKNQLANYRAQRKDRPIAADELGVSRSFELNSPQLVSRAIYEEIRRAQACVVDLTEWPANVLFELGVRLAVSRHPTTCIVERKLRFPKGCDVQCERLLALLVPESQRYDVDKAYLEEPVFARVYGPKAVLPVAGISAGMVYECVERGLQVDGEPAERPVYRELLDSAELFARVSVRAGVTKPVGLFPGNPELTDLEENAEFQRLLAAWLFLLTQFGEQKIAQDTGTLRASAEQIVDALIGRHQRGLDPLGEVMATLKRMQAAFATAGLKPEARLDELVALKQKATALRKSGELDLALATLNLVEKGLATMQAERRDDPKLVTQLRAELADTFGMRGGVHRRRNDLAAALADYKKGLDEEKEAGQSTYNLGNVITLSITLNHESPNDPQMRRRLDRAIELLERQTQSSRGDEWWALSDLGQFYLLRGDLDAARAAYARGRRLGPSREESGRHVDVLEELANAVKQNDGDLTQKMAVLIGELKATLR